MFKDAQYHELIRKTVVAFGTLFNDLYVYRKNSTGKTIQKMKVPLAYGPKQKFLTRAFVSTDRLVVLPYKAKWHSRGKITKGRTFFSDRIL